MINESIIDLRLSTKGGGPGNFFDGTANNSLGGFLSKTIISEELNGLFGNIDPQKNISNINEYRCIFVCNKSENYRINNINISVEDFIGNPIFEIGFDPTNQSFFNSWHIQAVEIRKDTIKPEKVNFSKDISSGIIDPRKCKGLWLRRLSSNANSGVEGIRLNINLSYKQII